MNTKPLLPRVRRAKLGAARRALNYEGGLAANHLALAMTIDPRANGKVPVPMMDGAFRYDLDAAVEKARELVDLGVPALYIIGIPAKRDARASEAWSDTGVVCEAARRIKAAVGDKLVLIGDSYLGYFTDHQIGGVLDGHGRIDDGPTREILGKIAVAWARAGIDIMCCSTMVDGRVAAARQALHDAGLEDMSLMSAIKFNSAFYKAGTGATDTGGSQAFDKSVFYIDPCNVEDAVRIARADIEQGAEMVNVKPGYPYLDVIARMRSEFGLPVSCYSISGEYAMLVNGVKHANLDEKECVLEIHHAYRRAGASFVISYWAPAVAAWLKQG